MPPSVSVSDSKTPESSSIARRLARLSDLASQRMPSTAIGSTKTVSASSRQLNQAAIAKHAIALSGSRTAWPKSTCTP